MAQDAIDGVRRNDTLFRRKRGLLLTVYRLSHDIKLFLIKIAGVAQSVEQLIRNYLINQSKVAKRTIKYIKTIYF